MLATSPWYVPSLRHVQSSAVPPEASSRRQWPSSPAGTVSRRSVTVAVSSRGGVPPSVTVISSAY